MSRQSPRSSSLSNHAQSSIWSCQGEHGMYNQRFRLDLPKSSGTEQPLQRLSWVTRLARQFVGDLSFPRISWPHPRRTHKPATVEKHYIPLTLSIHSCFHSRKNVVILTTSLVGAYDLDFTLFAKHYAGRPVDEVPSIYVDLQLPPINTSLAVQPTLRLRLPSSNDGRDGFSKISRQELISPVDIDKQSMDNVHQLPYIYNFDLAKHHSSSESRSFILRSCQRMISRFLQFARSTRFAFFIGLETSRFGRCSLPSFHALLRTESVLCHRFYSSVLSDCAEHHQWRCPQIISLCAIAEGCRAFNVGCHGRSRGGTLVEQRSNETCWARENSSPSRTSGRHWYQSWFTHSSGIRWELWWF